ncbi:MAG: ATP-grasp domain-containing protein [Candidatus Thermoplasmatota archaeon]
MSSMGIFVDRKTLSGSEQLNALIKCRDFAESMGHTVYFIFPVEIKKISKMNALFIRSRTDPTNISFVASKMAALHGIPVIDDPRSIQICSDKVNMYLHLMDRGIPIPKTRFVRKSELSEPFIHQLFDELGVPLVLKEPSTSFSVRVEKSHTPEEFMKIAKRFTRMADWVVVQEYVESRFDWRIGVLGGRFLYACRYVIPSETFKIQASVNGHIVYCDVESVPADKVPAEVIELGVRAANAIGSGLYGVDIKVSGSRQYVIEVNDNPSLEGGEDEHYPLIYQQIVAYLLGGPG